MAWTQDDPVRSTDVIGQRCGASYKIESLIGEGGMGQVYLARSEDLGGALAAVKVLQHELMRRPESLARFRAEAFAAGSIDDENIVHAFDTGVLPDGRRYMMMEYCAGGSLSGMLEARGPLPFNIALTTAASIGSALAAAHIAKITHRDIKPGNILYEQKAGGPLRAKLGDFGIAKIQDDQLEIGMRTGTKKMLGSPGYMAPEQCTAAGRVDYRADVYGFAACIYEMVTGRRPYPGNNMFDLINSVVQNAPFPRPTELRPDLPPGWEEVILVGLSHRREDRVHSIREMVMRLAQGVPNGEALVSYVAPRFIESKIAPTAPTIADGIGAAVTAYAAHSTASSRGSGRRMAGMLVLGLVLGALAIFGAGKFLTPSSAGSRVATQAPIPDASANIAIGSVDAGARMPDAASIADKRELDAGARIPDATLVAETRDAGAKPQDASIAISQHRDAGAIVDSSHTSVADVGSAHVDKAHVAPPPRGDPGTLHVEVEPWAEVRISGQKQTYPTPANVSLAPGHYTVVLTKGSQQESVNVTITPNKTTRIDRSW